MPATALRCRVCETQYPLDPDRGLRPLLRPARPGLRPRRAAPDRHPRVDRGRPASIWRYARCCPSRPPAEQRLAPGFTPLVQAPRLADALGIGELWLKLDTANPTHSFKDRVVAVARRRRIELGRTTLACSSTGNLANAVAARAAAEGIEAAVLVPGRPRAGEAHRDRHLRRAHLSRSRAATTTAAA